ncbi:hypothetical protein J31TS4_28150 [Paenibacillus sp. J31TS4]|uniref:GapA-binding peptide SR1P n=1 Tax=Paenibacillus sp. J31TS4 TaxID=2807195 RepID=UPI001B268FE5|nr:GapA-binding peptide SR1P [Paenibacillus sp. J31TS4]GIP39535.1 hypothetical protein J31TS4_28150 [Paenibacillus sp. J31TS4]
MQNTVNRVELGTIVCRHCQAVIGTQDTEKVAFYYAACEKEDCRKKEQAAEGR